MCLNLSSLSQPRSVLAVCKKRLELVLFFKLKQKLTGVERGVPHFYPITCDLFLPLVTCEAPLTRAPVYPAHPISSAYVTLACASQHFSSPTTFNSASTFTCHPTPDPISTTCVSPSFAVVQYAVSGYNRTGVYVKVRLGEYYEEGR